MAIQRIYIPETVVGGGTIVLTGNSFAGNNVGGANGLATASFTTDQYGIITQASYLETSPTGWTGVFQYTQVPTYDLAGRIVSNTITEVTQNSAYTYAGIFYPAYTVTYVFTQNYAYTVDFTGNVTTARITQTETISESDRPGQDRTINTGFDGSFGGVSVPNVTPSQADGSFTVTETSTHSDGTETFAITANPSLAGTYTFDPSADTWTGPNGTSYTPGLYANTWTVSGSGVNVSYPGGTLTLSGLLTSDTVTVPASSDHFNVQSGQISSAAISGGGTLVLNGNFNGPARVGSNSTLELNGTDTGTITFGGINPTLKIDGTTMPTNVISQFLSGDKIDLANVPYDKMNGTALLQSFGDGAQKNVLTVNEKGTTYYLQLDPSHTYSNIQFVLQKDESGNGTLITMQQGLDFNLSFDQSISNLTNSSSSFIQGIDAAAYQLEMSFANQVTLNVHVGYGEVNNSTVPGEGQSQWNYRSQPGTYSTLVGTLKGSEISADQTQAYNSLPSNSPFPPSDLLALTYAELKALGAGSGLPTAAVDGWIGLNTNLTGLSSIAGVAAHEFSEVMGRESFLNQPDPLGVLDQFGVLDLFRYSAPGVHATSLDTVPTDPNKYSDAYLSIDQGATSLGYFSNYPGLSNDDPGDWWSTGAPSAQNDAFIYATDPSTVGQISANDFLVMNLLGWKPTSSNIPVSTAVGATYLIASGQTANDVFVKSDDLVEIQAGALVSGPITFVGTGGTLQIDDLASSPMGVQQTDFNSTIAGFTSGETIRIEGFGNFPTIDGVTPNYDPLSNTTTLTLTDPANPVATLVLQGNYIGDNFTVASDPKIAGAVDLQISSASTSQLAATPASITGREGTVINAVVAGFTDGGPDATASDFTALINWGDGTTTTGTVVAQNGGGFAVDGTHTYAEEGNYQVGVTINDVGGSTATAASTAAVTDAPITATPAIISGVEGTAINAAVATFVDGNPDATASDFTALINWGDGTTSAGTVVAQNGGGFAVTGPHTYAEEGNFQTTVTITDIGGSTTTATSTATIADAPLTVTPGSIQGTEGAAINATVATFADANLNALPSDFSALINWGDGTTSTGTIVAQNGGGFAVTGPHTYVEEGIYQATVSINDVGGSTATATSTATIGDAPLTATAGSISGTEGTAINAMVASFVDGNPNALPSDFTATINWGDGITTTGTVVAQNRGGFAVTGPHTYTEEGIYQASITVNDVGGSTATATSTAMISDAPLTATAGSISGTEATAINAMVASFMDGNPDATASDFTAIINWGDGTTTHGTIVAQNGGFAVTGPHIYAKEGNYQVGVTITDIGGSTASATSTATIADAPLSTTPDSNGVARGQTLAVSAAKGVLSNDSDPDDLTVEAVDGRTKAVGHAIEGKYGLLTLNADGSYTYKASRGDDWGDDHRWDDFRWSDDAGIKQDVFKYTVSDGHGGLSTSTLSVVVFEPGTTYLSGANTTLTAGKGPYVLDGSAGGDTLKAGSGDAALIGGKGDTLVAGHGQDNFMFRADFGTNTIANFNVREDTLQFDDATFHSVRDILAHTTDTAAGAVISDGHGDAVTILGVTSAQLHMHEHDFHLV